MKHDFRVEIRVKNAQLYNAIMDSYQSVSAFSRASGLNLMMVGRYINFKESPLSSGKTSGYSGMWKKSALDIGEFLGIDMEELFPDDIKELKLESNMRGFDIDQEQMMALRQEPDPFDIKVDLQLKGAIADALDGLTAKEEKVITMRYGIGIERDFTLEEIAGKLCLTKERIRQIEIKAISKLRHPVRANKIREVIGVPLVVMTKENL